MIPALREIAHRILGRGEGAITVPPFDGALKPNQVLESAEVVAEFAAAEDLASDGSTLYVADGQLVLRFDGSTTHELRRFDAPVTAICVLANARLAVALDGREIRVIDLAGGGAEDRVYSGPELHAINALAPGDADTLLATSGSVTESCAEWARDLMNRGRTGRLLSISLSSGGIRVVASGLGYAFGVVTAGATTTVSESWRHRIVAIDGDGGVRPLLDHLPVYPSRISAAAGGGFWLTAFIARTQLVEFVLREPGYRRRMIAEIDPEFWIVPRLRSGESFREPMQGAHLKTMGVIKPWAPPRSYGLVVRLDDDFTPLYSLHSRVDGHNHGVVAAAEVGDGLYVLAKGPGRLLRLSLATVKRELGA
ncbi:MULTISPECIES: hypothetical protein [Rhodopseudomonas]|uniref:Strictosidine synthase conserved region domain-containing protein n=1 Tax=Rhodopseudomonas palustris TaxID=1076 RepID=A0A0D7EK86_RHOPL|nr:MULTISPECIES: hypothetical protein [Rhodopseudomonas]KIZ40950.1 hypothetical protein OO17_16275 [Rhodopseudomonas palustris]MDF3813583.1 hypothetical protein [Rhodopseudomonas sp. BAL398]WOK15652.1 hypothetical protein RBJ75_15850 [Rhodopseudomonas sp. BAL398]